MGSHDAGAAITMEMTLEQKRAVAVAAAKLKLAEAENSAGLPDSIRVDSPAQNWSNIGAESMQAAGIRPYMDPTRVNIAATALNAVPFNMGDELVSGVGALMGKDYGKELSRAREIQDRFSKAHPYLNFAESIPANVVASLMTGTPTTVGGMAAQGGALGAATGFGAGRGTEDRLTKAGIGGVIGGATSAALGALGGYANKKALPPETRGAQYVENIAKKSGVDVNTLPASSKPITAAEALGPQGETQLMALARREGQTGNDLAPLIASRAADRPARIMDDMALSAGVHPEAAKGNIDALVQAGQKKAGPLFDSVLSGNGPVWNQDLARLANRPAIRKAMALAADDLRNADINPVQLGLEIDPMIGATGAKQLQPTARAWDIIRKNLAGTVERDGFGRPIPDSISRGNHNINQATRDLTAALKQAIPGYDKALAVSGDYLSARSAFEQGQKAILSNSVTVQDFAKAVARMSPAEKEAAKGGIANKLFDVAQNGKLSPKQFLTDKAKEKLALVLGRNEADAFIGNLEKEAAMSAFERQAPVSAGSPTARLTQAMQDQDKFGGSAAAEHIGTAITRGPRAAAAGLADKYWQRIADALKTSGLTPEGRDAAGRLLMLPPQDLASALRASNAGPSGPLALTAKSIYAMRPALSGTLPLLLTSPSGR